MSDDTEKPDPLANVTPPAVRGPGGGGACSEYGSPTFAPSEHFEPFCLIEAADGTWHELPLADDGTFSLERPSRVKIGSRPRAEYRHLYGVSAG